MVRAQHVQLRLAFGQRDAQLQQEPVELGLRQRVRPLVLDRVLGRRDQERLRQRPGRPVDADLALLHRLEQRGLGLRRRPVDLVGEQQVREDRAGPEVERGGPRVVDQRTGHVAGHQVRGELDPLGVQVERGGQGAHEQRLRDAGHALQEHVAAAEQRHHDPADHRVLADDGLAHLGAQPAQGEAGLLSVGADDGIGGHGWSPSNPVISRTRFCTAVAAETSSASFSGWKPARISSTSSAS